MKLPKLKYYYYAMSSDAYIDFAVKRTLEVSATISIDLATGTVTGTTQLCLGDSTTVIDDHFRQTHHWTKPVYVLRIPRELINKKSLKKIADHLYEYRATLNIPHCGVERLELEQQ